MKISLSSRPTPGPPANQVLNHPVAEEKGEYTGKGEEPPKDCFWHIG